MNEKRLDQGSSSIRMLEFFSGIGGMRLALEQALQQQQQQTNQNGNSSSSRNNNCSRRRLEFCQAYDISLSANKVYQHNFEKEDSSHHAGLVCTKLVEHLKVSQIQALNTNLWTLSPPCQPFTTNGRDKEQLDVSDKRCNGLKAIIRLLNELPWESQPVWILLENVKGFGDSLMCRQWYDCLHRNGYSLQSYLLSPMDLGIPNHRTRFYVLATLDHRRPTTTNTTTEAVLPVVKTTTTEGSSIQTHQQQQTLEAYVDPSIHYSCERHREYFLPLEILKKPWAKGLGIVTAKDTSTHCFTGGYGRIYHRSTGSLILDTTTTKDRPPLSQVPLDRSDMTVYENQLRRWTPEELLLLFGFPKPFSIPVALVPSLEQRYKLIGNSINVTVVAHLLKVLLCV